MSSCIMSKHAPILITNVLYLFSPVENRPGSFLYSSSAMPWLTCFGSTLQKMTSASGSNSPEALACL